MHNNSAWVVVYNSTLNLVLLAKRSSTTTNPLQWNFFGGGIQKQEKETPIAAAVRELKEESGIVLKPLDLKPLGVIRVNKVFMNYYLYSSSTITPFTLNGESETAKWVSFDEAKKLNLHLPTKLFLRRQKENYPQSITNESIDYRISVHDSAMDVVLTSNVLNDKVVEPYAVASALVQGNQLLHIATSEKHQRKGFGKLLLEQMQIASFGKVGESIDFASENLLPIHTFVSEYTHFGSKTNQIAISKMLLANGYEKNIPILANATTSDIKCDFYCYTKPISYLFPQAKVSPLYEIAKSAGIIIDKYPVKIYVDGVFLAMGSLKSIDDDSSWCELSVPLHGTTHIHRDFRIIAYPKYGAISLTKSRLQTMFN